MRKWITPVLVLVLAGAALASLASRRNGLFNNKVDDASAIAEHRAAWAKTFPEGITPDRLGSLMRRFGGHCTRLSDLPPHRPGDRTRFSCEVTVPARVPQRIGSDYTWTQMVELTGRGFTLSDTYRKSSSL